VLVGDRFASPKALADAFRSDLHSVLIGTLRFWEGFDVPGEACSLVAIVRLPFERRDPLTEARYAAAERDGRSWFDDLALPDAMLTLRQGVGRGIRTSTDRAVVAILDGRIDLKQYGRAMLEALPRTAILRRVDAVAAFLASP
jgi:Rad3-related DNA helicase